MSVTTSSGKKGGPSGERVDQVGRQRRRTPLPGAGRDGEVLDVGQPVGPSASTAALAWVEALDDLGAVGLVDLVDHDDQAGRRVAASSVLGSPDVVAVAPSPAGPRARERSSTVRSPGPMAAVASTIDHDHVDVVQRVGRRLVQPGPERAAGAVDARRVDEDDLGVGAGSCRTPRMRCRVVLGRDEVIATLVPTIG